VIATINELNEEMKSMEKIEKHEGVLVVGMKVYRSKKEIPPDGLYITTDIPLKSKMVVAMRNGICEWYYKGHEHHKCHWSDMPEYNEIYGPVAKFSGYAGDTGFGD
jgi:hypothetical protein